MDKIPVVTIFMRMPGGQEEKGYTVKRDGLAMFLTEFEEVMDEGYLTDEYVVRFHRMEKSELDNMPEFEGW